MRASIAFPCFAFAARLYTDPMHKALTEPKKEDSQQ